jgi:uncharacterized protein (TIGR00369 family)
MKAKNPDYETATKLVVEMSPFAQDLPIRIIRSGPGWCEMELNIQPRHKHMQGYVHAGVLMTITDQAAGCAATSIVAANEYVLTCEYNISFLRVAQGDRLVCRGTVVKPGRKLVVAESVVQAFNKGKGRVVAKARVTLAVLGHPETTQN